MVRSTQRMWSPIDSSICPPSTFPFLLLSILISTHLFFSVHRSSQPAIQPSSHTSFHPSSYLSNHPSIHPCTHPLIYPPVCPSVYTSCIHISRHLLFYPLPIHPSIHVPVYASIHSPTYLLLTHPTIRPSIPCSYLLSTAVFQATLY